MRYKGEFRASSMIVLDRPTSASRWSSSSRSCLYWRRRSHSIISPASQASGIFQDHPRSGSEGLERFPAKWARLALRKRVKIRNLELRFDSIETEKALVAPRVLVELPVVLPQDMFLLRSGAKQRLARELVGRLST